MKLSVIIPVYNNLEMTQECIAAVRANTQDYEIVIVDNGSEPPIDGATVRNETNLGFPVAVNQGIKAAKGEVIVLLNNDCVVSQGWSERLLYHLDSYSIVGPVANYCAGMQRVAIPVYQDEQEFNLQATKWAEEHDRQSKGVNWVIGFCMVFKKSLWEEVGNFDESLWPCSGEEIDFCYRAKQTGHRVGIALDVYVHHYGSVTFMEMENAGITNYKKICTLNEIHLSEKWGEGVFVQEVANE